MMDAGFFLEMAWKSALIAGAALLLAAALRPGAAAERALVLRIGTLMLLALPAIALLLPALRIEAWAAPEMLPAGPTGPFEGAAMPMPESGSFAAAPETTIWDDPTPLVLLAYLGGLAMAGSHLAAGLWTLGRWTAAARPVICPEWLAALERARGAAPGAGGIRLLVSDLVPSPLSWGWRRPAILIDPDTLEQTSDAEAILAHEVAHVARGDWPVLMLSRVAASLFWFNPLVWLLEREIVQQAEEAADCAAAERVEPARYAETLLSLVQIDGAVPANSIAPSARALARRVNAILYRLTRERPSGSAWTALAILVCIAVAAPVAAMELVAAVREAPEAPEAPEPPAAPDAPLPPTAPDAPAAPKPPHAPHAFDGDLGDLHRIGPDVREALASVLPNIPAIVASATAAIDSDEIEEGLREAEEQMREMGELNRDEIAAAMREARRSAATARAEAAAAARQAQRTVRASMLRGADGMLRGADGMERGARGMDREAERLRTDRAYREHQIARARERGETVTHEELIEAAESMREGAEGMREGARGMREAARDMRDGGHDD